MQLLLVKLLLIMTLALSSCSTPVPEIEVSAPPRLPTNATTEQFERKISGQVFWTTEGGDTIKVAGGSILIFDAAYLASVHKLLVEYADQHFELFNSVYAGAPGRIFRAKFKLQDNLDIAWSNLAKPLQIITTDADGRFEFRGQLPARLGLYCEAGRRTSADIERIRWAVLEEQFPDPSRLILSNKNRLK
jgi:hypothetical protein